MASTRLPRGAKPRRRPRAGAAQKRVIAKVEAAFPVVAIGASAGGLDAFRTLLTALPAKSSMAFILVQHLDPSHTSMMVELLSPCASMPVLEAGEGTRLQPGHIYIGPPGRYLAVRDGTVHHSRPTATKGVRMPIDFLLQSLAEKLGERVVCLILSGTGTDGSVGAKAIKEAGGLGRSERRDVVSVFEFMTANQAMFPIQTMCKAFGVSRAGYYVWLGREPSARACADAALTARIEAIQRTSRETYGAPRVHAELVDESVRVGRASG